MNEYLLNDAQDLINLELKDRFEKGEITSLYEIFYEPTYLDVIQIFDYTLPCWNDVTVNQELRDLLFLIKNYNVSRAVAVPALRLISAYIIHSESLHYWNRKEHWILKYCLQKYFPAHKPLNYDYLRFVINSDILNENEVVVVS